MLEYALKQVVWHCHLQNLHSRAHYYPLKNVAEQICFCRFQERAKYSKLKYGNDPSGLDLTKPPVDDEGMEMPPIDGENYIAVSNVNWRQGRQLLRQ